MLDNLKIFDDYSFRYHDKSGVPHVLEVKTKNQLLAWVKHEDIDITKTYTPEDITTTGGNQAKEIILTFQKLYPAYLFATVNSPRTKVEDYLEGEVVDVTEPEKELAKFVTFHQSYSY